MGSRIVDGAMQCNGTQDGQIGDRQSAMGSGLTARPGRFRKVGRHHSRVETQEL